MTPYQQNKALIDALMTFYVALCGVPISVDDCCQFGFEGQDCFTYAWKYTSLGRPYQEFYDNVMLLDSLRMADKAQVWWLPETVFWISHYEWCYDSWYQLGISQTNYHSETDRYRALFKLQKLIGPENYQKRFIPVQTFGEGEKKNGVCFRYPEEQI